MCARNVARIYTKDFSGWAARSFAGERYARHYTIHSHFVRHSKGKPAGMLIADLIRRIGIIDADFYFWKKQYANLDGDGQATQPASA